MLVTSILSSSHNVVYPENAEATLTLSLANALNLGKAKSLSFVKVPIAANWKGVCLQNTSKSHLHHLKIWPLL